MFDYLVVGAGFAGATMAERLAADGDKKILICDRRPHIGGNAYDHYDEHGVLVHKYGPHIFHTNSKDVFDYLSRFTEWWPYQHRVLACVDGQLLPMPINLNTVNRLYGTNFTSFELENFFKRVAEPCAQVKDFRGCNRQQGWTRALRKILPQLHAQALGSRSVGARRRRNCARPGAHEPR